MVHPLGYGHVMSWFKISVVAVFIINGDCRRRDKGRVRGERGELDYRRSSKFKGES